mgnify:CR=1 FL=1
MSRVFYYCSFVRNCPMIYIAKPTFAIENKTIILFMFKSKKYLYNDFYSFDNNLTIDKIVI